MRKIAVHTLACAVLVGTAAAAYAQTGRSSGSIPSSTTRLNTKSSRELIENFVKTYNKEGSIVYPLYAEKLEWIEMPSGRRGGHDELFAALKGARTSMKDLHLDVLSITADVNAGVLESELHAMRTGNNMPVVIRVIWFFGFENDKIVKEHDYSIAPAAARP